MSISFNGLASGLDTTSWVDSLVALRQAKVDTLKEEKEVKLLSRETLNGIKSFFNSFRAEIEKVTDVKLGVVNMDIFAQKLATSSDVKVVTASVTSEAEESTYNVEVGKLATQTQAISGITTLTSVIQTVAATSNTKLADLGVKTGDIGITNNGVKSIISIEDSDTINSFIEKLKNIGVNANFNENTGIFSLNLNSNDIDDTLAVQPDGNVGTGIVSALKLSSVGGYESSNLQKKEVEVIETPVSLTTKLSELGSITAGDVEIKADGASYLVGIDGNTQLGDFINTLKNNGIDAKLSKDGIFSINNAELVDVGNTGLIEALGLKTEVGSNTQLTGVLKTTQTGVVTNPATGSTKISELGTIKNGNITIKVAGTPSTLSINQETTLQELIDFVNLKGGNASLSSSGSLTIDNTDIIDTDNTQIIDALGLQYSSGSSSLKSNSMQIKETSTTQNTATLSTTLSNFKDFKNGNIVLKTSTTQTTIALQGTTTLQEFIGNITNAGGSATLSPSGDLVIENVEINDVGNTNIISALGLITEVGTKKYESNNLTVENVTTINQVATVDTKLSEFGNITSGNVSFQDSNSVSRFVHITDTTTIGDLINDLGNVGINATLQSNGELIIDTNHINDYNTGLVQALGFIKTPGSLHQTQSSKKLEYQIANPTTPTAVPVNGSTKLEDLGIKSGNIELISNGVNHIVLVDKTQTIDGLVSTINSKGITASFSNGEFSIKNATLSDIGNTDIVSGLNLVESTKTLNTVQESVLFTPSKFKNPIIRVSTDGLQRVSEVDSFVSGTTYKVSTAADLQQLSTLVNSDNSAQGCTFVMSNDIDLSSVADFDAIGGFDTQTSTSHYFEGNFNGNGYVVKNLTITHARKADQGLFGCIKNAKIENLGIENSKVIGGQDVGALVGELSYLSIVDNCYSTSYVSGRTYVGGLVGNCWDSCNIFNCSVQDCRVEGNTYVGGLVGTLSSANLKNSSTTATVVGDTSVGAFAGSKDANGIIENSKYYSSINSGLAAVGSGTSTTGIIDGVTPPTLSSKFANEKLVSFGITEGAFKIMNNGAVKSTHNITANYTVQNFMDTLASEGVNASIVEEGTSCKIVIDYANGMSLASEDSNIASLFTQKQNTTTDTVGQVQSFITPSASGSTKLEDLGIKSGNIELISNGVNHIVLVDKTQTIDGLVSTINSKGITASFSNSEFSIDNVTLNDIGNTGIVSGLNLVESTKNVNISQESNSFTPSKFKNSITRVSTDGLLSVSEVDSFFSGTTYKVSTVADLQHLAILVNSGNSGKGSTFILANDIDLSSVANFNAIGGFDTQTSTNYYFEGNFNGNGYVVKNLTINKPQADFQGLFGNTSNAIIENLGLENVNVIGKGKIGGLVGSGSGILDNYGTIDNCYVTGSVLGENSVGGLVGFCCMGNVFNNSVLECSVEGNDSVGGFVGTLDCSNLKNSSITATVSGNNNVGALVGKVDDTNSIYGLNTTIENLTYYSSINSGLAAVGNGPITGIIDGVTPPTLSSKFANEKLVSLGITEGAFKIMNNGVVKSTHSITANYTVQNFMDTLASEGVNASIVEEGTSCKIVIDNTNGKSLVSESSNIAILFTQKQNTINAMVGQVMLAPTTTPQNVTATNLTKLSELGTITDGNVQLEVDGASYQIAVNQSTTIQDLVDALNQNGANAEFKDGVLNIKNGVLSDLNGTNVVNVLGLSTNTVQGIARYTSLTLNVDSTSTTISKATESSKLSDLGVTTGEYIIKNNGTTKTFTIGANDTLGMFMDKLRSEGLQVNLVDNGNSSKLEVIAPYNYDVQSSTSPVASNVVQKLLSNSSNGGNRYSGNISYEKTTTTFVAPTETSLLSELGITSGEFIVSKDGVNHTIGVDASETIASVLSKLSAIGVNATLKNNGNSASVDLEYNGQLEVKKTDNLANVSNIVDKLFAGKNVSYSEGKYTGSEIVHSNVSGLVDVTRDTLLADLGVTTGEYNIYKNGVKNTAIISSNETLGSFMDTIAAFGIQTAFVDDGTGKKLVLIGNGDSYIKTSNSVANASNVVDKLFGTDKSTNYNYSTDKKISETVTHLTGVTEDTLLSDFDTPFGATTLKSEGNLAFDFNGETRIVKITDKDTFGTLIKKLDDIGVKSSLVGGKFYINDSDGLTLNTQATTSSIMNPNSNLHLSHNSSVPGFISSSTPVTQTITTTEEKTLSVAKYADLNTKMKILNISDGTLSIYRNGEKALININSEDTFGDLRAQIASKFSDVDLKFENGKLILYSKSSNTNVKAGSTVDTSNLLAITGLTTHDNGESVSSRSLYCLNENSKILTKDLFRKGDITKGNFFVGSQEITIDDNTTMQDVISQINSSENSNATAYWDSVNGEFVITSRTTGQSFINIEAGTSNFTDIMGYTETEWNSDNSIKNTRMIISTQKLGENSKFKINETNYSSTSNIITSDISRIEGITINLNGLTKGSSVTLKIEKDKETLANTLSNIVDSYNELMKNIDKEVVRGGKLHDQTTLKMIRNQVRNTMTSSLAGDLTFKNLDAIGISVKGASANNISTSNDDIVSLTFDKDKFIKAYEADSEAVKELLVGKGLRNAADSTDGVLTRVEDIVERSLASVVGYFSIADDAYKRDIKNIDNKIVRGTDAIERYRAQLTKKFSAMDMMIAKMQQQYTSFLG